MLLILAAVGAMVAANSSFADDYFHLLHLETGPVLAPAIGPMTVHLWVNDGLMALFFLLVGLEIKRELIDGALANPADRRLPVVAAIAGMVVPAAIYLAIAGGEPALTRGWAIPAATDIAFAIGVMALLGKRVPAPLKLFLTTVAIVDDMGAVAIIALAYSHGLDLGALAAAAGTMAIMFAMNRRGVKSLPPYLIAFALLWFLVLLSGVHATIAGVLAAAFVPITPSPAAPDDAHSPLHVLEHGLSPWVNFAIVPIFGFANAGVALGGAPMTAPVVLAVAAGLFLGKQAGIFGAVWLADRSGFAKRPARSSWAQVYGASLLAGIGFTMSLFIGGLAFPGQPLLVDEVKIGVLAGSALAGIAGYLVLRFAPASRPPAPAAAPRDRDTTQAEA